MSTATLDHPGHAQSALKAAFDRYMAADNKGRGFVLIGHDQGAGILSRLIASGWGSAAEPSNRSATHSDWSSAIGMIAPRG